MCLASSLVLPDSKVQAALDSKLKREAIIDSVIAISGQAKGQKVIKRKHKVKMVR